jgi:hypothetical protein
MQIRRAVATCLVALVAGLAWPVYAQRNNNNQQQARPTAEQIDVEALFKAVDAVAAGTASGPVDVPIKLVQHHFLLTQSGTVMVPFTFNVDKTKFSAPAVVYVRLIDKDAVPVAAAAPVAPPAAPANNNRNNRNQPPPAPVPAGPIYPVSTTFTIDVPADGQLSRAFEVKPGRYELFVAVKERGTLDPKADAKAIAAAIEAPIKAGLLRQDMTVPDLSTGLGTSSVILADSVEPVATPLTTQQQMASPYTIGGVLKIAPNLTGRYGKAGELATVFWVYGVTSVSGKPDVQVEYNFHRRLPEGEKYFNKTEPQQYNAQTSAPTFNLDAGHQLMAIQGLSVQGFPAGDYRLEIKVTDKPSGKTVTQNVNFTVLPV